MGHPLEGRTCPKIFFFFFFGGGGVRVWGLGFRVLGLGYISG